MTSKLKELKPHQTFALLKNASAIPKLQYELRASLAYLCREELRIFVRSLFDSLGRVAYVSLEGDMYNKPGSHWVLALLVVGELEISPCLLFFASTNYAGDYRNILSITNIADSNELVEAEESWRGLVLVLPCLMTRDVRRHSNFLLLREIKIWYSVRRIFMVCRVRLLATAQKESVASPNSFPVL